DRQLVGYCVGINADPPGRVVKSLVQIVDEHALLTPHLLKLTRWMADYYVCGWGQVLNAVLPSGVKRQAGTRAVPLIELIPENLWLNPPPALGAKQRRVLDYLQAHSGPVELRRLLKEAKCGLSPIRGLLDKGYARRRAGRAENLDIQTSI